MSLLSVYCVFADAEEAERIGRLVIEERLAACINILGPCRSIYAWEGAIEASREVPAILKTSASAVDTLIARLAQLHSYDVPAITAWPVAHAFAPYAAWVAASTEQERDA